MASQRSPSPSASSIFLPLGRRSRRGSRASVSSETERENLNQALNQIHTAACQSDALTVFNEFTSPPSPTATTDQKNLSGELQGGLSGLYSRFRASVGGVKDKVGGAAKPPEVTSPESTPARSPYADSFPPKTSSTAALPGAITNQPSLPATAHVPSKTQSPSTATFPALEDSIQQPLVSKPKMASKPASVSSRASITPSPALKSPVGPLTKATGTYSTADPTVTEVHVNAVKDRPAHTRTNSGNVYPKADSASFNRSDSSINMSISQGSLEPISRQSNSPVLLAKSNSESLRESRVTSESNLFPRQATDNSINDSLPRANKSVPSVDQKSTSDMDLPLMNRQIGLDLENASETAQENRPNDLITTFPSDQPGVPSSLTNSLSKASTESSINHDGRTPITIDTSLSIADQETPSAQSKESLKRTRERQAPRVSQSRLPGFTISRSSSLDIVATRSVATGSNYGAGSQGGKQIIQDPRARHTSLTKAEIQAQNTSSHLKSRLLSKDFWMRDENAKDCFLCGEPFSTFRRKHHCRTCGQIFDSKCTVLVPGIDFGHSGSIRVCKPCEAMINAHEGDSSDYSGDEAGPIMVSSRTSDAGNIGKAVTSPVDDDDASSIRSQSIEHVLKTPMMAIPATRRTGDGNNRRSAILEFDSDRPLPRPTSSRSLKSSFNVRPHSMHKRHHSRQQYIRSFKPYHEERAPFQRRPIDELGTEARLPAFHRDSIIDPDLAQYLSDDASSGDEQPNLFNVVYDNPLSKSNGESEKLAFGGLLAAVKKGRSRFGERSGTSALNSGRDADDGSVSSSRAVNLPRSTRKRNLSVASSVHQRLSPRASKEAAPFFSSPLDPQTPFLPAPNGVVKSGFKMTRSSSMRGEGAPPVELNKASLEHVRKLLHQLLRDASISHAQSWETALMPILLKATDDVDPDVQRGDNMDIRHYVKLKKIPGGRPGDTSYLSGLVFTKNLALKSMPRSISHPNIVIITFALEYARHEQHFMSLEPVIRQEREFLENLVSRIVALRPDLLLVEKNISGLALQLLEKANIATAYNVKPSVIEAVSRCSQTRIITSMDKLAVMDEQRSQCGSFDLKTYVHQGRKKTYMYLSGCPKELGCTIILRGTSSNTLVKVKRITEFMVYVVYNLKLETCLMRDEFAKIPSQIDDSISTASKEEKATKDSSDSIDTSVNPDSSITETDGANTSLENSMASVEKQPGTSPETSDLSEISLPAFYEDMVEKHQTKILSSSPFVKFEPPYLLMRARELERRLAYLKKLRDQDFSLDHSTEDVCKAQKFVLITPGMVHQSLSGAPAKVKEVLHAVHDAEYDKALHDYQTQRRQWEAYISGNSNLFDPYAHQNIVVLYSLVCTTTSIPCSGPDIFAMGFYNEHENDRIFEADCTLGQYVEDLCQSANSVCTVNGCERRMFEHHRQYVHGEAQVTVFTQPYPSKLRGLQDTILMWSCCKICGNETQAIPMSESTWKYSFGKYLEVSFWSRHVLPRAGVCPHDLHRDHLRFFGYKDVAIRIHYDSISLLEIIVPRTRVTWKVENDLKLRNEVYTKIEKRLNRFMLSVKARLKGINVVSVMPELMDSCKKEIERLIKKANDEHIALTRQLQELYMNSRYWEVIPLNEAIRATQEKVVEWDAIFSDFEKNFFPSEKDIRRLASLQLRKIFLDKDVSVTSLTSTEDTAIASPEEAEADDETTTPTTTPENAKLTRRMTISPEKAKDVLVSVVEEHSAKMNNGKIDEQPEGEPDGVPDVGPPPSSPASLENMVQATAAEDEISSLDLAVPSEMEGAPSLIDSDISPELLPKSRSVSPVALRSDKESPETPPAGPTPRQSLAKRLRSGRNGNASGSRSPTGPYRSSIPRPEGSSGRRGAKATSPPLFRAYSQPPEMMSEKSSSNLAGSTYKNSLSRKLTDVSSPPVGDFKLKSDRKLSDRLGLGSLKTGKLASGNSLIPRSIPGKRNVSSLAKHFEQLSREFEKERFRERQQRVAMRKKSRAFPMVSSKPIVQVYRDVQDAVEEREPSDEDRSALKPVLEQQGEQVDTQPGVGEDDHNQAQNIAAEQNQRQDATEPSSTAEGSNQDNAAVTSDVEGDEEHSDADRSLMDELQLVDSQEESKMSNDEVDIKELPKHERSSLLKMLTNFWAERSASGWVPLEYPLTVSDHVFADCDVIVREDEPSSLVAFALDSADYKAKLSKIQQHDEEARMEDLQADVEHSLLSATGTHLRYQFSEGPAKMLCKVFYAEQFDALRRKCGVAERIVESLSRCAKFDSKGGKTNSLFLKTLDDRLILKSLSTIETQAFLRFAPAYFQIMSEALFHELPSAIAKMFGFYQVIIKNPATGVEFNYFLLVMENLFYDRVPKRIFDLKGSMRNRKVQSTGERNEVLLDENMVEFIYESPLFSREHSKKLLSQSVWNDTLFLARQNVMDYSLMIAIDANRQELVVGIIDCIRTYTWDKKLESWIKDRGFAGGGKNKPTVTSPKEYKSRFREAMARYVLHAPNPWHQFQPIQLDKRQMRMENIPGRDQTYTGGSDVDAERAVNSLI